MLNIFYCSIIVGVMIPTWFLSMWMSNTATALLMVTIIEALLDRIDQMTGASSSPTKTLEE